MTSNLIDKLEQVHALSGKLKFHSNFSNLFFSAIFKDFLKKYFVTRIYKKLNSKFKKIALWTWPPKRLEKSWLHKSYSLIFNFILLGKLQKHSNWYAFLSTKLNRLFSKNLSTIFCRQNRGRVDKKCNPIAKKVNYFMIINFLLICKCR